MLGSPCSTTPAAPCRTALTVVKSATGNAAKAGIEKGDTVIYTSSFFGTSCGLLTL